MTGYTKLFGSIIASTVWREPNEVRILWITMLAMADKRGIVEASIPGLADLARLTLEQCETGLEALAAPDPYSRTKDHEGRRIEATEGGWLILNHAKYRAKMNVDDRREYLRIKKQEERSRQHGVNICRDSSTLSTHAEASPSPKATPVKKERRSAPRDPVLDVKDRMVDSKKGRCTQEEAELFCKSIGLPKTDGEAMFLHWEEKGWAKVKDWRLTIRKWQSFGYLPSQKKQQPKPGFTPNGQRALIPDPNQERRDREYEAFMEERRREKAQKP